MTTKNHQWIFLANPEGAVTPDIFEWREANIPILSAGNVLVRNRSLSLDPANRAWMRGPTYREQVLPGDVMHGFTISEVVESGDPAFASGDIVEAMGGWQEYALLPASELTKRDGSVPYSDLIGIYGITGLTAYFGLFDIGAVKVGETVVISAAAGAVGSAAGQIARNMGANVVGIAGGADKCAWLTDELGYHAAVDYKDDGFRAALKAACPNGIDVYFDNVGGKVLDAALRLMNQKGRVICCGAVANYDIKGAPFVSPLLPGVLVTKRIRMEGFIVLDHMARRDAAEAQMKQWIEAGTLKPVMDLSDGLENAPEALIRLLAGGNRGKVALRLG